MKIKLLTAVFALILSVSCSDDFLVKLPETVVPAETFYKPILILN